MNPDDIQSKRHAKKTRDEDILYFSFAGMLPEEEMFVLEKESRTLSHMGLHEGRPRLLAQAQLTPGEFAVLLPLLNTYPYYCPYENIHAHFTGAGESVEAIATSKAFLQKAINAGLWDQEMKPVRTLLSRIRFKIRPLEVDLLSLLETGYILHYRGVKRKERHTDALPASPLR